MFSTFSTKAILIYWLSISKKGYLDWQRWSSPPLALLHRATHHFLLACSTRPIWDTSALITNSVRFAIPSVNSSPLHLAPSAPAIVVVHVEGPSTVWMVFPVECDCHFYWMGRHHLSVGVASVAQVLSLNQSMNYWSE